MKTKTLLMTVALLISNTSAIEKNAEGDSILHKTTTSKLTEDGKFIKEEQVNLVYNDKNPDESELQPSTSNAVKKEEIALEKMSTEERQALKGTLDVMESCPAHYTCKSQCCIEPYGKKKNMRGRGDREGGRRGGRGLQEDAPPEDSPEDTGKANQNVDKRMKRPGRDGADGDPDGRRGGNRGGRNGGMDRGWRQQLANMEWEAGDRMCMPREYCSYVQSDFNKNAGIALPLIIALFTCFGLCGQRYYYDKKIKEAQDDQRVPEYAAGINESPGPNHQIPVGQRPASADLQGSSKMGQGNNMV